MPPKRRTSVARVLIALALLGSTAAAFPARAAEPLPGAPTSLRAFEGVDGIRLAWDAPAGGPAPTAYQVQRAATPYAGSPEVGSAEAPFLDVALVPAGTTSHFDVPVGAYFWSYRVLAVGPGGSVPGEVLQTRLGYPPLTGPTFDQVFVDGGPGTPGAGGAVIDGATGGTVTASRIDERTFRVVATPPAGAADDRAFSFVIGSTAWGHRFDNGTYPSLPVDSPDATAPVFRLEGQPQCSDIPGTLQVGRADFLSDGTPLTFSAQFTYCGTLTGSVAFHSPFTPATAVISDRSSLTFTGAEPQTVNVRNAGKQDRYLGTPVLKALDGTASTAYTVSTNTCGGKLAAGATCAITLAAAATDAPPARLSLADGTENGRQLLLATGPVPPVPTAVRVGATLRGVDVSWAQFGSAQDSTGYVLHRGTSPESLTPLATVAAGPGGRFIDRSAAVGTTYYYAVSATSAAGEGPRSIAQSATPSRTGTLVTTSRWSEGGATDIALLSDLGTLERLTTEGDNSDPDVSPDGASFAYASNREAVADGRSLWIAGLRGAPRRLTDTQGAVDSDPRFSPDGSTIAFTRLAGGTTSLWTVPATGGTAQLVPASTGDSSPSWAPSGRVLAASHREGAGPASLVVTNLNGSVRRTVAAPAAVDLLEPSWSPDSRSVSVILRDGTRSLVAIADVSAGPGPSYHPNIVSPYDLQVRSQHWGPGGIVFEATSTRYSSYYKLQGATLWKRSSFTEPQASPVPGADTGAYGAPSSAGIVEARTPLAPYNAPYNTIPSIGGDGQISFQFAIHEEGSANCYACPAWTIIRRSEAGGPAPKTANDGVLAYEGPGRKATVTGLTNGQRYAFTFFNVSTVGDVSKGVSTYAGVAKTPSIEPTISVLSALSGDGPNFSVGWGKTLPAEFRYVAQVGARAFDAKKKTFAASPSYKVLSDGSATRATVKAKPGTTYYVRVRIQDPHGAQTPWSAPAVFAVPHDDRAFAAKGTWASLAKQKGRFAATLRESSKAGSTLTLTAPGTYYALIADKCPTCGKVQIYVDGKLRATVDTYAKKATRRAQVWALDLGKPGAHKIVLKVVGKGKKKTVRVDGLIARP